MQRFTIRRNILRYRTMLTGPLQDEVRAVMAELLRREEQKLQTLTAAETPLSTPGLHGPKGASASPVQDQAESAPVRNRGKGSSTMLSGRRCRPHELGVIERMSSCIDRYQW